MHRKLFELAKKVFAEHEVNGVLEIAIDQLIELSGSERGMLILFDEQNQVLIETARNLDKRDIENPEFEVSRTIIDSVRLDGKPVWKHNALEDRTLKSSASTMRLRILSIICIPLIDDDEILGVIYLDNRKFRGAFSSETFTITKSFAEVISLAARSALERRQLRLKQLMTEEAFTGRHKYNSIIGQSVPILEVLKLIDQVAESDAPVLIEGETGTGKELVARAIHQHSKRDQNKIVTMNCGALPENLLESMLFGHEKGAFTGAHKRQKGKFE